MVSPLDLRAIQETLDWHDAPPEVGEVVHSSTLHETAILQLWLLLAALRAHREVLQRVVDNDESKPPWQYEELRAVLATVTEGDHP